MGTCRSNSAEDLPFTRLILEQHGDKLVGTHHGEYVSGDLSGSRGRQSGPLPQLPEDSGHALSYDFTGTVEGDKMGGTVNMGEYGEARWVPNGTRTRPRKALSGR